MRLFSLLLTKQQLTANITGEYIYGVLSTFPVLNSETMYTTSMSAALGTLETHSRNNVD